jgi:hypothetical protein
VVTADYSFELNATENSSIKDSRQFAPLLAAKGLDEWTDAITSALARNLLTYSAKATQAKVWAALSSVVETAAPTPAPTAEAPPAGGGPRGKSAKSSKKKTGEPDLEEPANATGVNANQIANQTGNQPAQSGSTRTAGAPLFWVALQFVVACLVQQFTSWTASVGTPAA